MRQLLAVDGSSLAHRAWHSTREDALAEHEGGVTAAFVSMLATIWAYGPYASLIVAFDHPVNHRKRDFPEYKAQRTETPDDLRVALGRTFEHLEAAGVAVRRVEGVEADDLLAAASDGCRARSWTCDLLSSDRDLIALVGGPVRLLRPRRSFADIAVEDEDQVRATYGVDPSHYIDLAALRGDVSDGLTGAPGIGPTRASRLVRDHGSVTNIYRALPDLPPAVARALRQGRDDVERNLLLMSPIPHLDVDLDDVAARGAPLRGLAELVESLGLPTAARRVRRTLDEADRQRTEATGAQGPRPPAAMPPMPPPPGDADAPD